MSRNISWHSEVWPSLQTFRTAYKQKNSFDPLVVEIAEDGFVGRGESMPVTYLGDTLESMSAEVRAMAPALREGLSRTELQQAMPASAARNAIDCALWDLECQISGRSIWELTGIGPAPVQSVITVSVNPDPAAMVRQAVEFDDFPLLKVKLDADRPVERIAAIRKARPDARIVVDANQAWDVTQLSAVVDAMHALGVEMVEQPLARGQDAELSAFHSRIPLCADESCLNLAELDAACERYQMVNIKLDKCGGLTAALELAAAARERDMRLMVGGMGGTSLAMIPSAIVAQNAPSGQGRGQFRSFDFCSRPFSDIQHPVLGQCQI